MAFSTVVWNLDDDPNGNVEHCAQHGISREEVEEVLERIDDLDVSRSTGRPIVFGETAGGRHLMVVIEVIDDDTIYPITAYEVPRRRSP